MKKDKNNETNHKRTKKKLLILAVSLVVLAGVAAAVFLLINNNGNLPVAQDTSPTPSPIGLPDEPVTTASVTVEPVTTEPITTEPVTTEPVTTEPAITGTATVPSFETEKPFELVAEKRDEAGTATDSGYRILLAKYEYTAEQLTNKISIVPETKFTIEKKSDGDYMLKPSGLLSPNKVYSFQFSDEDKGISYSWAFQTRAEFFVTSTLPRNEATYVPVNTGIEVTFSEKVESDLSRYFEISPNTPGRFEIHKNTVVYVPDTPLSYDTVYTVTVKKGFSQKADGLSLKENTVFSFQTQPEPTEKGRNNDKYIEFVRDIYNLYPNELQFISVYSNIDQNEEVELSIYQYSNEQEFKEDVFIKDDRPRWCIQYNNKIDYSGKEEVFSIKTALLYDDEKEGYYRTKFLELPDKLPEGYYVAVVRYDEMESITLVQINGMAVYIGSAENKTIGFIYDSLTSTPVEGAEIVFDKFSIKTGADGIAVSDDVLMEKDGSKYKNYTIIREGHPSYYYTIGKNRYNPYYYYSDYGYNYYTNFWARDIQDKYWGYLYTDREMYLLSDTINVWGMLAGKDGSETPREVTVRLSKESNYYSSQDSYTVIDEKKVNLSVTNTFKTSIAYENLSTGYYILEIINGDEKLLGKNIYIREYTKPIYKIDTSMDKTVAAYGEKLLFEMETKFFEGTPVHGMEFNYYIQGLSLSENTGILKTDENGRSSLNIEAVLDSYSWKPKQASISVTNKDPEETTLNAYEYFTVFPRDVMVKVTDYKEDNEKCTVTIDANKIDLSKIQNIGWYQEEDYKGAPVDVDMEIELYEIYYTSEQIGTYYDFINKITYPKYRYDRHEKMIQTINARTVEGKYSFDFTREKDKGYYITIKCKDSQGRPIQDVQSLYNAYYNNGRNDMDMDYYYLETNKKNYEDYTAGEEVKAYLLCNGAPCVKKENTKVLYMLFRKGMLEYTLSDDPVYSFTFKKEYIPNVGIMAVYFDGKNMNITGMNRIDYDKEASRLNIEVTPAAQEYRPGDTAVFNVKVSDPKGNGKKTEILFSIVDEAYFALWDQKVNILEDIYNQVVSLGYLDGSIPHTNPLEDNDGFGVAEGGEGGDETPVRSDFKDTALFESVITDDEGKAQISVKLPDNLTKWRVTSIGLTDDLYAGNGTINIDTRLPYFINSVFNSRFITLDKPVIQIRSFGTAAVQGEKVNYTVAIKKDGQDWKNYSISSTIGERALVQTGALEEGSYTYTITGRYKSYTDAVMLPFEVVQGFVEQPRTQYSELSENMNFPDVKWPVKIYFFNENVRSYWEDLLDLSYSWGERIDSIIVRKQARKLLQDYFDEEWHGYSKEYDLSRYQLSNGGIALLPYDSANPVLTAKISSLKDSSFDYKQVKDYFYRTLTNENAVSTDIAASYWGLAGLREPILPELSALLKSPNLKLIDKLYIGLAYADIGDLDTATDIYRETVDSYMKEDSLRAYIIEKGYDSDDTQEATSLCALLSQKIKAPERQKFFEFVSNMYGEDILTNAMRLAYIQSNLKNLNFKSSFVYELDGKKEKVTIDGKDTFCMFLTAKKLSQIRFSDIEGKIVTATVYKTPIGEISETDSRISITRTYSGKDDKVRKHMDTSEYIKVTLKVRFDQLAPTGYYMVEDYLPASLKYVSTWQTADKWIRESIRGWYPHVVGGQRVSFTIHRSDLKSREVTIEYFARAVNIGICTAESATVFNLDSNIINYTPREMVTVE